VAGRWPASGSGHSCALEDGIRQRPPRCAARAGSDAIGIAISAVGSGLLASERDVGAIFNRRRVDRSTRPAGPFPRNAGTRGGTGPGPPALPRPRNDVEAAGPQSPFEAIDGRPVTTRSGAFAPGGSMRWWRRSRRSRPAGRRRSGCVPVAAAPASPCERPSGERYPRGLSGPCDHLRLGRLTRRARPRRPAAPRRRPCEGRSCDVLVCGQGIITSFH
jgi:hypothetical protein